MDSSYSSLSSIVFFSFNKIFHINKENLRFMFNSWLSAIAVIWTMNSKISSLAFVSSRIKYFPFGVGLNVPDFKISWITVISQSFTRPLESAPVSFI